MEKPRRKPQRASRAKEFVLFLAVLAVLLVVFLKSRPSPPSVSPSVPTVQIPPLIESTPELPMKPPVPQLVVTRPKSPLEEQIGDVVDVYPTDPRGQEVMRILEEAFADDPQGVRKAKWLDELSLEMPPAAPDIEPTLPPEVLFHNIEMANSHWDAFQQRNPKTAEFLIQVDIRPIILEMPGDEGPPLDPKYHLDYGENWDDFSERWIKRKRVFANYSDLNRPADRRGFLSELAAYLLLRDFFLARGGEPGRRAAYHFKTMLQSTLISGIHEFKSQAVLNPLALETVWPYFDVGAKRCRVNDLRQLSGMLTEAEYLRLDKWGLHQEIPFYDRELTMINRLNAYVRAGDYGGQIICCYACYPDGRWLRAETEIGFRKRFGDTIGMQKRNRYFELVDAVRAQPLPLNLPEDQDQRAGGQAVERLGKHRIAPQPRGIEGDT